MNKISIKLVYKDETMDIELPEAMVSTFDAHKLGTIILFTWDNMKKAANKPIPLREVKSQ